MKIQGAMTALITPFIDDEVDFKGLQYLIEEQVSHGIDALVILGTTGEAPTLTCEEQESIIAFTVQKVRKRVPVIVGTGSFSTTTTIEKTARAKALGADAALIVTPYYNKPTQEGIFRHFEAISKAVALPYIVYNIQGRCGVNVETETLLRIAGLPYALGVKEASGNIVQAGDVMHRVVRHFPDFLLFSGDDVLTLPMMALGASGVISVASNLIPRDVSQLVHHIQNGAMKEAQSLHYRLLPLYKALFFETNPMPIKEAMRWCGRPGGECRLPLCSMREVHRQALVDVLEKMGFQQKRKNDATKSAYSEALI